MPRCHLVGRVCHPGASSPFLSRAQEREEERDSGRTDSACRSLQNSNFLAEAALLPAASFLLSFLSLSSFCLYFSVAFWTLTLGNDVTVFHGASARTANPTQVLTSLLSFHFCLSVPCNPTSCSKYSSVSSSPARAPSPSLTPLPGRVSQYQPPSARGAQGESWAGLDGHGLRSVRRPPG